MKKKLAILLSLALIMTMFAVPVLAEEPAASVVIDGKAVSFDVAPVNDNGRLLVPLRAIFEQMGATVTWDDATQAATAVKGDKKVVIAIGSLEPTVNGQVSKIDVAAKLVSNRTLAPMRFVCEAFGGKVNWDEATKTASVVSAAPAAPAATDKPAAPAATDKAATPAATDKKADAATAAAPATAADLAKAVVAKFAPVKVKTDLKGTVAGIVAVSGQADSTIAAGGTASSNIQGDSGPLGKSTSTVAACPFSELVFGPEADAVKLVSSATLKDYTLTFSGAAPTSLINFLNGVNAQVKWSGVTGDITVTVDKATSHVTKIEMKNGKAKVATPLGDKDAVFEATFDYTY